MDQTGPPPGDSGHVLNEKPEPGLKPPTPTETITPDLSTHRTEQHRDGPS